MLDGTEKALPRALLYATSARLGGSGLDSVAFESLRASIEGGFLKKAVAFGNARPRDIPPNLVHSLRMHSVRLLSFLERPYYYGAKKHCADRVAARELARGSYDFFHGWSGESVRALRVTRRRGIPSVVEIPTWHRNKGKQKPPQTRSERERAEARFPRSWLNRLLVTRQQVMEEYDLADLILVLSEKAIETFVAAGIARGKLCKIERGVDIHRFSPATAPPAVFRVLFVGALIKRKGVHHLLEAWHRLALPNAELVLVGDVHEEMRPSLNQYGGGSVRIAGFATRTEDHYRQAAVHILPSTCEGSAKTTYEAAASGLPQIVTRESGDVVIDGVNGLIIPPADPDALAAAVLKLHRNPALRGSMGGAARARMVNGFTWDHFRERLLNAYRTANSLHHR